MSIKTGDVRMTSTRACALKNMTIIHMVFKQKKHTLIYELFTHNLQIPWYKLFFEIVKHNFQILCFQQLNINHKFCNLNNYMM
jgi:hypothetical protein